MIKLSFFNRKRTTILVILIISLVFLQGEIHITDAKTSNLPNENIGELLSYTEHPGFNITHNDNFTHYGFSGTGAPDTPYIIENYNITTTEENGIYITETTKHFVIQNCYINADYSGIYISNVAANTTKIVNTTCIYNTDFGIRIYMTSECTLLNNNCTNNLNGIYISSSTGSTLINNTCVNSNRGIWLNFVPSVLLINNTCNNNNWGADLSNCHDSIIVNNTFNDAQYGLCMVNSDNCSIENNICQSVTGYGFFLSGCDDTIISFNKAMNNNHGIYFTDNSQRARVFNNTVSYNTGYAVNLCTGAIFENNTVSNNVQGIQVPNTNCTIENNIIINNEKGNRISKSLDLTIRNNNFYNDGLVFSETNISNYLTIIFTNNWVNGKELGFFFNTNGIVISAAIYGQLILVNCSNIIITNQQLSSTSTGISLHYCEDITIENSNYSNNSLNGIYFIECDTVTINENKSYNNTLSGIHVEETTGASINSNMCSNNTYGIYLKESPAAVIFNNTCENNSLYGIYLYGSGGIGSPRFNLDVRKAPSDSCLITYNNLINNTEYGIFVETDNNEFYNNTFIDNNLGGTSQAYDEGTGNNWYDTSTNTGNYWSEWSSGSYSIDGSAGSVDLYPLSEIPIPPIIAEYGNRYLTIIIALIPLMLLGIVLLKRKKH